jgi:uncharacterized membrane-anchored protein YhcB (DUF1043 family)
MRRRRPESRRTALRRSRRFERLIALAETAWEIRGLLGRVSVLVVGALGGLAAVAAGDVGWLSWDLAAVGLAVGATLVIIGGVRTTRWASIWAQQRLSTAEAQLREEYERLAETQRRFEALAQLRTRELAERKKEVVDHLERAAEILALLEQERTTSRRSTS